MLGLNKNKIPLVASVLASSVSFAAAPDLNNYEHLRMTDKELGQLRWAQEWANLPEADFFAQIPPTQLENIPLAPKSLTVQEERYIISFWTYALALEQFNKLNAMPDFFKDTIDTYIQRMQHYNSTWYWEETSQFGAYGQEPFLLNNNPAATGGYIYPFPYPEEKNPVRIRNTMFKNHMTQMVGLYQKLYGDYKYSEPNSLTFTDSDGGTYDYDFHELVELSYWEMKKEDTPKGPDNTNFFQELAYGNEAIANACIECEPNMCWAPCNTHVMISLKLHDEQFGTNYFEDIKPEYKEWMDSNNLYVEDHPDPNARYRTAGWHTLKQDETLHPADMGATWWEKVFYMADAVAEGYPAGMLAYTAVSAANEGWTVTFMNSYSEDVWGNLRAQDAWSTVKARHYHDLGIDGDGDYVAHAKDGFAAQISTPFFASLAGEAGDYVARDRLLSWSDKEYLGQWGNSGAVSDSPFSADAYWYPPEARNEHLVSPLYLTGVVGNGNCDNSLFWGPFSWLTFGEEGGGMDLCALTPSVPLWDASEFPAVQGAVAWTGTLVAMARANTNNGMRDLIQEDYVGIKTTTPKVRGVNWPAVKVRRAIYDESENALIVTTGGGSGGATSYEIYNMDPKKVWTLYIDNVETNAYVNTDTINVTVPYDGQDHDVVLVASAVEGEADVLIKEIEDLGDHQLRLTLAPIGECVQSTYINGSVYTADANGLITADIDTSSISEVVFTSHDCDGNTSIRTIKLTDQIIDSAMNVRYNQNGVWAIGEYIEEYVNSAEIHNAIKAYNGGKLYDGVSFDIRVDQSGDYDHGGLQLSVSPINNSSDFNFSLNINDLNVDLYKRSCSWFWCSNDYGYLSIDDVVATGTLRMTVTNNDVQLSVININSNVLGSSMHQIGGLTYWLSSMLGLVDKGIEAAVEGFSIDLIEIVGADAIENLPLNLNMQIGSSTLNINGDVNSVFNSYGGTSVQLDGQSSANNPLKTIIGSLYENLPLPDGRLSPSGTEHPAVVVVSSNMINQFYSELNRSGELDTEVDVSAQFMAWFGDDWGNAPYAAKLKIKPVSSPYVSFTDTEETQQNNYVTQGSGRVYLDGFTVSVEVKETSSSSYVAVASAFVSASLGMDISVNLASNKLLASFTASPDHTVHEVTETLPDLVNSKGVEAAVSHVVPQTLTAFANELGNIELPELDGFRLNATETWTINKANVVFGGSVVIQ